MVWPLKPAGITNYVLPPQEGASVGSRQRQDQGWDKLDGLVVAVQEDFGGTNKTALDGAYAAAVAAGGGTVWLSGGAYTYNGNLNWNSNLVSVKGAGASAVTLTPSGAARIVARPSVFTVDQGPRFSGFTVQGHGGSPCGIHTGDITGSHWDDIVVRGFSGGIGVLVENQTNWTERNYFGLTLDDCLTGMQLQPVDGSVYSFEYNRFDLRLNANAGQVGIRSVGPVFLRGGQLVVICNVADDGTVASLEGAGGSWIIDGTVFAEQTSGTGGKGFVQGASVNGCFIRGSVDLGTLTNTNAGAFDYPTQILGGGFLNDPATGKAHTPIARQLKVSSPTSPPTVGMLGAAGTSPPAAVVDPASNNVCGRFTCGTGTSTTSSEQFCQVNFAEAYDEIPVVSITAEGYPGTGGSGALRPFVFNVTTVGFWVGVVGTPAASQDADTFGFAYQVIG